MRLPNWTVTAAPYRQLPITVKGLSRRSSLRRCGGAAYRSRGGHVSAMERYECDIQLRPGNISAAGYGISDVLMNIVVTGIANLAFTFVAIYTVDRLGRKTLMLTGAIALAGIYTLLGLSYFFHFTGFVMIIWVVLAIGFYAMSLGPVTWVLLSEIFPNRVRGVAMAVCTAALWVASFLLTYTFPFLNSGLGTGGTFMLYAGICLAGSLFVWRRIPETKGKSLEELENELVK